jgi:hypothetical protein
MTAPPDAFEIPPEEAETLPVAVDPPAETSAKARRKNRLPKVKFGPLSTPRASIGGVAVGAGTLGAASAGAFALGALSMGIVALGVVAVGQVFVGRARLRHVVIDTLEVKRVIGIAAIAARREKV